MNVSCLFCSQEQHCQGCGLFPVAELSGNHSISQVYCEFAVVLSTEFMFFFVPQFTTLLGGIGGILGVYMGFSFMALFELIDIFGRSFSCCGKKDTVASIEGSHENRDSVSSSISDNKVLFNVETTTKKRGNKK